MAISRVYYISVESLNHFCSEIAQVHVCSLFLDRALSWPSERWRTRREHIAKHLWTTPNEGLEYALKYVEEDKYFVGGTFSTAGEWKWCNTVIWEQWGARLSGGESGGDYSSV